MSANRFIEQEKIRKSYFLPLGIPAGERLPGNDVVKLPIRCRQRIEANAFARGRIARRRERPSRLLDAAAWKDARERRGGGAIVASEHFKRSQRRIRRFAWAGAVAAAVDPHEDVRLQAFKRRAGARLRRRAVAHEMLSCGDQGFVQSFILFPAVEPVGYQGNKKKESAGARGVEERQPPTDRHVNLLSARSPLPGWSGSVAPHRAPPASSSGCERKPRQCSRSRRSRSPRPAP